MNKFRQIWLIVTLLMGFVSSLESAHHAWDESALAEFSEHDKALIQSLLRDDMKERERENVVHIFKQCLPQHRASIVASTLRLLTPAMQGRDIFHLMNQIYRLTDFSNREHTIGFVQQLIAKVGEADKPWEHMQVLQKLSTIEAMKNFVDFVCDCPLFKGASFEQGRPHPIPLMYVLGESPDNDQRANLIACAAQICGSDATIKEQILVIRTLVKIANNQDRESLVAYALCNEPLI